MNFPNGCKIVFVFLALFVTRAFGQEGVEAGQEIAILGNGKEISNKDTTPSSTDGTDFGSSDVEVRGVRGQIQRVFTVKNQGTMDLRLTGTPLVKITGTHAGDFFVTKNPASKIEAGAETTFEITFAPNGGGTKKATVSIANDDADENPYTFALQGIGKAPDINVKGNGYNILKGDLSPSVMDGTDFGAENVPANGEVEHEFTVENLGTSPLEISGVKMSGTHAGDFTVTQEPASGVEVNTKMKIKFAPKAKGTRNAIVIISNSDKDEREYNFAVKGTGLAPEIEIRGNGVAIARGDASPRPGDGTDFGACDVGSGKWEEHGRRAFLVKTFTVHNLGNATLELTGSPQVSISGPHAGEFSVEQIPEAVVAPGKSSGFKIRFCPQGEGLRQATITVASNDVSEGVYLFGIQGKGLIGDIAILGNGEDIDDGDATPTPADGTDFGGADVEKGSVKRSFSVKNLGNGKLSIGGVTIEGLHAGDFAVGIQPATSLAAGGSTTFTVVFSPKQGGVRQASVSVSSDDGDENPYTFALQGMGYAGEIAIQGNGNEIAHNSETPTFQNGTDLGPATPGSTGIVQGYKIQNKGVGRLFLTATPLVKVTCDNDPTDFAVTLNPLNNIGPLSSTRFNVTFRPKSEGTKTATVYVANSDPDEGGYTFRIQGTGQGNTNPGNSGQEINLQGNGQDIVHKDTTPSTEDGTDFGSADAEVRGQVVRSFTIQNTGSETLTLTGKPRVKITGSHAGEFFVTQNPAWTIAGGESTLFEITFAPNTGGTKSASVSIANDDADENPYTFAIKGVGALPEIDVKGNGVRIVKGDLSPCLPDGTDFGAENAQGRGCVEREFAIENTGAATLRISGVKITGVHAGDFSVSQEPSSAVSANSSTTFRVLFSPKAKGTRNATIVVSNNDKDEGEYNFAVKGTGQSPEITILGNGVPIARFDDSPSKGDGTDFGPLDAEPAKEAFAREEKPGSRATLTRTFALKNTGNATLALTGSPLVEISGEHRDDFVVVQFPSDSIIAGQSSSFKIEFRPRGEGIRRARVLVQSNDLSEQDYFFALQGQGLVPDITVLGNGEDIDHGDATPTIADGTDFGGTDVEKGSLTRTFTVKNLGTGKLNLENVLISGANQEDFSVVARPAATLACGGSTTFKVMFKPLGSGLCQATIAIQNNDGDENPYEFAVQGVGYGSEIVLKGNGNEIPQNSETAEKGNGTDFGPAAVGLSTGIVQTFKIQNLGLGKLFLTGSPLVKVTPEIDKMDFTVSVNPPTSVLPQGSATFQITFRPKGGGTRSATVYLANSDTSKGLYTFKIQGTGVDAPEMSVLGNGKTIADGDLTPTSEDSTDFGGVMVTGETESRRFTLHNSGNADLRLTGNPTVTLSGTHAADFTITSMPNILIFAGGSTYFSVQFDPRGNGKRTATINIKNNDLNENPYNFNIQGTGTLTPQEMTVTGNGQEIVDGDTTPSLSDHTDFGDIAVNGSIQERTYRIYNLGGANLKLTGSPKVQITGEHASDFTVVSQPESIVMGSSYTTLTVRFDPSANGTRNANLVIASNDEDENAYDFAIQGNGIGAAQPEMQVKGNGVEIADGDATPGASDYTDFGNVSVSGGTQNRTFTLLNIGNAELNLTGTPKVAIGGVHAGDFVVTLDPTTPVAVGKRGSTTFTVRFTPGASGLRSATVSIANDDEDENPYDFAIQGTGVGPEMLVKGNGVEIVDGDNTPSPGDHTDFGSVSVSGGTLERTFTLQNTGNASLNLAGTPKVVIGGSHAGEFTVITQPATPISPNGTTGFVIRFDPSEPGTRSASVSIANDDADENPYNFAIQGTGTGVEMQVKGNGVEIVDGDNSPSLADHTDFGEVLVNGATQERTFVIHNLGNVNLNLTGSPKVVIGGSHAADFTVTTQPTTPVSGARANRRSRGQTTFTVRFDPSATGTRSASVSIANDDTDENPYNFAIQGTGTAPEIQVTGNGVEIVDGDATPGTADHTDFGGILASSGTIDRTFTIYNTGNAPLNLTGSPKVAIGGTNADDFTVTVAPTTPVPGSRGTRKRGSTTFTVRFDPSAVGTRTASVTISNDDSDENPYDFTIQGTGTADAQPEMQVTGNGVEIADNDESPGVDDHTDFGTLLVDGGTVERTFTLHNLGNAELNLTGTPRVSVSGLHAADFTVTADPTTPVSHTRGYTTFTLRFDPSDSGTRSASISIANDDSDENPYNFAIQGTGVASQPEMQVKGNGVEIVDNDNSPGLDDHTDFDGVLVNGGTQERTFTIYNTGNAPLNLTGSPKVVIGGNHAADFTVTTQPTTPIAARDRKSVV